MALDPRRTAAPKPSPRRGRPRSCVWWFLFGVILGSFAVGLYWVKQAPGQLPAPVAALPKSERPAPQQPSFQFEKILRETVVDSKDNGKPPPPPAPRPEPPQPEPAAGAESPTAGLPAEANAEGGAYILQVGSFTTAKEADAMKAKLAMLGVTTRVQTVTLKNGQVWHRVITGHLNGKKTMEATRATLQKNGTEAIPVPVSVSVPANPAPHRPAAHAPAQAPAKPPAKPPAHAPAKPVAQAPAKPAPHVPAKPAAQAPAKPVAQAPAKPVAQAPAKPAAQAPAKPAAQAPAKPAAKVPVKPVAQAPAKPAAQVPVKPVARAPARPSMLDDL